MRRTLLCLLLAIALGGQAPSETRMLDDFSSLPAWSTTVSDGVAAQIEPAAGESGQALRVRFDFAAGAGYASVHRQLPISLPENYEISFRLRGSGPPNNLEFKLVDASGDNVWWHVRRDMQWPSDWRRITIRRRQIEFAWGPTSERTLRQAARVDFTISTGQGGAGFVEIDDLQIRALAPPPDRYPALRAIADSEETDAPAAFAIDDRAQSAWRAGADAQRTLTVDLGIAREFGGLVLRWEPNRHATRYAVEFSDDCSAWRPAHQITDGDGGIDALMLTESEARCIRLRLEAGASSRYGLAAFELRDLAFGATPSAFFQALAREAPRADFPRSMSAEQCYWTLVGVERGGPRSALISEDGALEIGRAGFSVEPFVFTDERRVSWADVSTSQSLADGHLPIPSVRWAGAGWTLDITAAAAGPHDAPLLLHQYEIANTSDRAREIDLVLAIRPFQVNPPQQFLNTPGGFSPIREISLEGGDITVNGAARIRPLRAPAAVRAVSFDDGAWISPAAGAERATSAQGFAAGALIYPLRLAPHARTRVAFVSTLASGGALPAGTSERWFDRTRQATAAAWRVRLSGVRISAPADAARVIDSLRASAATILMSADGPSLQPGTRSYGRSWIRDGAMMAEGLLRLGLDAPARDYLSWYAPYQFASGKVPCCVGARGADPVPENDSHGELIYLAALVYKYTGDRAALDAAWPHLEAAARYMNEARLSERTPENRTLDRLARYGLMPPTISHEGYSARPAYSYWDNFWTLRGFEDMVTLATARGENASAARWAAARDEFRSDLLASIEAAGRQFNIDFIPGAADLGDFDATSTTIAIAPGGLEATLPRARLQNTFDRYWANFVARRESANWRDYTPYELRTVGTFARLGQRERALAALDFFFLGQRPAPWRQWAEVVGREPREQRFVGDLPHGWVASDYVRSALDLFAYDRERDGALVLAAGLPEAWLRGSGVSVAGLRTPYGRLDYELKREGEGYILRLAGGARPPGGFILAAPAPEGEIATCVNGVQGDGPEIRISGRAASVRIAPCRAANPGRPRP